MNFALRYLTIAVKIMAFFKEIVAFPKYFSEKLALKTMFEFVLNTNLCRVHIIYIHIG